jgi:hypothetical protein
MQSAVAAQRENDLSENERNSQSYLHILEKPCHFSVYKDSVSSNFKKISLRFQKG